jgi:GWxTD domain-containing protein
MALAVLALGFLPVPNARADKMSKEDKAWLDSVAPLMLQDEEKRFKDLKDKSDREEFKKVFWARRDPNLDTPENEYQVEYQKKLAEVDPKFKRGGRPGSQTDCGRAFILLGEPSEVKKEDEGETWTYKDRPGQTFQGGQAVIAFDEACQGPSGPGFRGQMDRVAEAKIGHPNIDYRLGPDGHIMKLADQLPKPTPAQALLKTPRQDFPVAAQTAFLKVEGGGTAVMGLVQGDASGLAVADAAGGKKSVRLMLAAQAVDQAGKAAAFAEQEEAGEVRDGRFYGTYRMVLKPGKYTLKAGALEVKSGKGSLVENPIEVPDFSTGELSGSLFAIRDVEDLAEAAVDQNHPYQGFALAKVRLIPHFGAVFSKADSISLFFQFYDAKLDATTGKGSSVASVAITKSGKPLAKAQDQSFETVVGGNIVGPIPLADFPPGSYKATVKVTDNVAKKDLVRDFEFEVK